MRGGQWQVLYLLGGLPEAVLLAPAGTPLYTKALQQGLSVHALSFLTLRKMARDVGLVHAHDARAHTLAALAGGAPLVVSRRVGFAIKGGPASRWKYGQANLFLAVSNFTAGRLRDAGIPAAKIRTVYDGVPIPDLTDRRPTRVVALASKPVQIPGVSVDHTSNLWESLAGASVFVYKSEMEGLGSASLAAQAAGVPVVVSNVGGLPETVSPEPEPSGFVVQNEDFATPVKRLLYDPRLAETMGRAARARVQAQFSVDIMIQKTLQAYRELLG